MAKAKIMNFLDGKKEIKIGDTCVCYNRTREDVVIFTVKNLGLKFATMEDGSQFDYVTGKMKSRYTYDRLYSTKEAYEGSKIKYSTLQKLKSVLSSLNADDVSDDQLKAIKEAMKDFLN